jgi:NodT family efflux transporter outer membrane factor (OMF) lipoprotein
MLMSRLRRFLAPASALLLAACAPVGPDFQRPQPAAPAAYTGESLPDLGGEGQRLVPGTNPSADWWQEFHSEDLDQAMEHALAGNRSLAAARASLRQAHEAVTAQAGAEYPQVDLDAGVGRDKYGAQFSGPIVFPPFTYYSVGPSVSYLLDYTGGERRAVEQQRALEENQRYQLQAAYLSLTGNVARQAVASAAASAQIEAVQALLDEDRKNVELVHTAFEAGAETRVSLLAAQSQLANDETLLPPLRQQLAVARHALSVLAGEAPAAWTPPGFSLEQMQLPQQLPLSLPSELAHRRPDILAAEAKLHAATAAEGVAVSQLYPQITLSASVSQQSSSLSHLFESSNTAWGLAAGLTAPVFDGGTLRAERRGAHAATQAATASYEQTVVESFGQVADVLTALDHDAEQLAAQQNAVDSAEANLNLTRESYAAGNVGVLQVLDAERQEQKAKLGYVQAMGQRYQDTVALYLALGGSPIADDKAVASQ